MLNPTAFIAVLFCRIAFCYVIFTGINNIQAAFLQYKNIFIPQIIAGYCISIFIIVFI
jgi:peptidoglycan biosynthesis protein MviN/MurJ (putative lipid II flippase)